MVNQMTQRQAAILSRYPSIRKTFEALCATRCGEITDGLLKSDENYNALVRRRADTSQAVLKILSEHGMADYFEMYSDAVHAEEVYETSIVFREAFFDAIETMERMGIL